MMKTKLFLCFLLTGAFTLSVSAQSTYFFPIAKWDGEARTKAECINVAETCVGWKTKCAKWAKWPGGKTCIGWKTICVKKAKTCSEWRNQVSHLRHESGLKISHPTEKNVKKYVEEVIKTEVVKAAIVAFVPADPATKTQLIALVESELKVRLGKDLYEKLSIEWTNQTAWTPYK